MHKDKELIDILFEKKENIKSHLLQKEKLGNPNHLKFLYTSHLAHENIISPKDFLSLGSHPRTELKQLKDKNKLFYSETQQISNTCRSKATFEKSQTDFLNRMQIFLDKKKKFILEEQNRELKTHHPTITYKGYMAKSKSIDQMAFGNLQRKNEVLTKMREIQMLQEINQLKPQPEINQNNNSTSRLGLHLSIPEYIKIIQKKNIEKEENLKKVQFIKAQNELKECYHKPEVKVLDRNILNKRISDKKENYMKTGNYLNLHSNKNPIKSQSKVKNKKGEGKYSIKNKENIEKQENINNNIILSKNNEKSNNKQLTLFEEDIEKIKSEIRMLIME